MAGDGIEPLEGTEDLVMDSKDTGMGGCHTKGIEVVFQGGGTGGTPIQVGDVGDYPPHGKGPIFKSKICQADYGDTSNATGGWELGVTTTGDSNVGGGV